MLQDEKHQQSCGLTRLSPQVFVRDAEKPNDTWASSEHPHVIIIYGWGDGLLKHVVKYLNGFRQLYPHAKQILVLSPMIQTMLQDSAQRTSNMMPVIETAFPRGTRRDSADSVLMHVMSSTGAINYASTLNAYRQVHGVPLPHSMTSYDSTAGGSDLNWRILLQWSYALALGTPSWVPLPLFMMQFAWGLFICMSSFLDRVLGRESLGTLSKRIMLDEKFESRKVLKVYMYSKQDRMVSWMDIENGIAEAKGTGYMVECVTFEGSDH
ncbi:hypothetical protein FDECE_18584, partial [Fusarium decemcellulare]